MDLKKTFRKLRKDKGLKRLRRKAKKITLLGLNKAGEGVGRVATKGTVAAARIANKYPKQTERLAKTAKKLPSTKSKKSKNKKLNAYEKAFYWGAGKGIAKESVNQIKKEYKRQTR